MKATNLFRMCLADIPDDVKMQVDLSFDISDKINTILQDRGMTRKDLAVKMGKKESEVSKWMSGTHNFTLSTLSKISAVLGCKLITVS